MVVSLRTKLSIAFIVTTMTLVLSIGLLANFILEKHFRDYVIEKQKGRNTEVVTLVAQQYGADEMWRLDVIENIGMNSLEEGMILRVRNIKGDIVWDATRHNNGLCQQMLSHMAGNMMSRYANWQGDYVEEKYPLTNMFTQIGTVEIGYYGPFYFDDRDLYFINALNTALLWITFFALIFSLFFAYFISKKLSMPIARVIYTTQMIAKGDYTQKIQEHSSTKEIKELTAAANKLAETLETQDNLRKRLTADVAHELRTPMTTLQNHMEAMIDGIWKPTAERLKSCYEEIIRINKMIGDLHLLAKFEGEELLLNKSTFDLGEMISSVVTNYESQFRNKDIEINYSQMRAFVYADQDKLRQVLVNLLSNALKYTPERRKVDIEIQSMEDRTVVIIRDTGSGIPAEDLPYIFERFYRGDKSRNRMTGGAGIGLAITKAIIEAHGGTIEAKSEIHMGTEFKVVLLK